MINYIVIFLASLVLMFLDHLFFTTLGIYISPLVLVVLFEILPLNLFFVLILLSTLGLDVTFHYSLGLWLFSTTISLGVFRLFNQLVHIDNFLVKLIPVFMYSVSLYVVVDIMASFPNISQMFSFSPNVLLNVFFKAVISTLLYSGIYIIAQYFRSDKSNKVKLK